MSPCGLNEAMALGVKTWGKQQCVFSISICPPNGLSEEGRWLAILLFTQGVLTAACIAWNNHGLATRCVKAARAIQLKPKEGLSLDEVRDFVVDAACEGGRKVVVSPGPRRAGSCSLF